MSSTAHNFSCPLLKITVNRNSSHLSKYLSINMTSDGSGNRDNDRWRWMCWEQQSGLCLMKEGSRRPHRQLTDLLVEISCYFNIAEKLEGVGGPGPCCVGEPGMAENVKDLHRFLERGCREVTRQQEQGSSPV